VDLRARGKREGCQRDPGHGERRERTAHAPLPSPACGRVGANDDDSPAPARRRRGRCSRLGLVESRGEGGWEDRRRGREREAGRGRAADGASGRARQSRPGNRTKRRTHSVVAALRELVEVGSVSEEVKVELGESVAEGMSNAERDEALAPMLRKAGDQLVFVVNVFALRARGTGPWACEQERLAPTYQSELSPSRISTGALYPTMPSASCAHARVLSASAQKGREAAGRREGGRAAPRS